MNNKVQIKLVMFDIDGVFTDGTIFISGDGKEMKRISVKDIDAFFQIKREGFKTAFVTGEATPIVQWFKSRFVPDYFISGCKDKGAAIQKILAKEHLVAQEACYIGDSKHDIPAFHEVGFKVCPHNAASEVQSLCDVVLQASGGDGAILELLEKLHSHNSYSIY